MVADAFLVIALSRKYGKRLASYTLAMLCLTSGCFFASTSMYSSSWFLEFLIHFGLFSSFSFVFPLLVFHSYT